MSLTLKFAIFEMFTDSDKITDASLIPVLGLPNIQYVYLTKMPRIINNSLLTKMLKLKSLKCIRIDLIENSCFRAVMESSKNIEYLQVFRCPKVFKETLIADAMRITENRKSNTRLKLLAPTESFKMYAVKRVINVSPYLQISDGHYSFSNFVRILQ